MAFKRALWSSGYTYQTGCPNCGNVMVYTDRQLDFRPWFPDGFIYCSRCRKPLRHNEYYAINPDGSRVFNSVAEASQSIKQGYYNSYGAPVQPQMQNNTYTAPQQSQTQNAAYTAPQQSQMQNETRFCPLCGRQFTVGKELFCSGCGNKLG